MEQLQKSPPDNEILLCYVHILDEYFIIFVFILQWEDKCKEATLQNW